MASGGSWYSAGFRTWVAAKRRAQREIRAKTPTRGDDGREAAAARPSDRLRSAKASILMPAGFFLGGLFIYSGDPGLGILLVPVGGALLLAAVFLVAKAALRRNG